MYTNKNIYFYSSSQQDCRAYNLTIRHRRDRQFQCFITADRIRLTTLHKSIITKRCGGLTNAGSITIALTTIAQTYLPKDIHQLRKILLN